MEALSDDLLREVSRRYGLSGRVTARRLTGGFANDVFRLDGDGAPTVVHVKHPPVDAASIDWEHHVLATVSNRVPVALPPLAALDGSTWFLHRERPVWLVPWAPGDPARPTDRRAVAAFLGRLHSFPAQLKARPGHDRLLKRPLPPLRELPVAFEPWLTLIARARAELTELVDWLEWERRPVTGLTHNDIFEGNVLVHQGRLSAVLDWEEADVDWLVWDLASTLWPFCADRDQLDEDAVTEFLHTYRAAGGPVPPDEDDLIVPLVRSRRILEVLRAPTDRDPQWDLQLANVRAYTALG
jgi:Ser/Thr protein kinase RdoA (MazF antagonist)